MKIKIVVLAGLLLLLLLPLSACSERDIINISVSAHNTLWVSEKEIYEIRNRNGELSAVIVPDKSDIDTEKGWLRPKGNKYVAFTLYLNPEYDYEELRLEVSGILHIPLSVTPVQSDYFTGGKKINESVDTAVMVRYCLDGNPLGKASVAFRLTKIDIAKNCWAISSIVKGTLSNTPYSDTTGFKEGFSEVKKGDCVGRSILGEDYNIVIDLKEMSKGRFITFMDGAASVVDFKVKENDGKYSAAIEGEAVEVKIEFGNLVIKRQSEDTVTVMRFTKTSKGQRD